MPGLSMMTSPTSPEPTSTISTFASTPVELTALIVSPILYREPPVETDAPVIIVCTVPVIDTSGSELSTPVMVPHLQKIRQLYLHLITIGIL